MRNKVNKVNIELKRDYFTYKIASHEGDIKSTWKIINLVLNKKSKATQITTLDVDGEQISNYEAIAEHMNKYFCNIGEDLSKKIPATRNPLLEGKHSRKSRRKADSLSICKYTPGCKCLGEILNFYGFWN